MRSVLSGVLAAGVASACSGGGRSLAATVSQFLNAWQRGDSAALTALVYQPPPGFAAGVAAITSGLHASSVTRVAAPATVHGSKATAPLTSTYSLPGIGPWKVSTVLALGRHSGNWLVEWSPSEVAPGLTPGQKLSLRYSWPDRAAILGAGGAPLTEDQPQVVVGVQGSRVKDPSALTQVLLAAGAPAASVTSALSAAAAHPTFFEPVFTLPLARYQALGGDGSTLHNFPGTVFQHTSSRAAVTPGLAAHLVGSVGPVTAEQLGKLGPPYTASSTVGQGGLEAYYESQLAGRPGGSVVSLTSDGHVSSTLASFPSSPGKPVATSIDPVVQKAAEQAMSAVPGTAGFVAVRVSTGEVLAAVSLPASAPFDAALNGAFPPGSTFKVLTSTALFHAGLNPSSPASCPPTATVDGKVFKNAEGDKPVSTLAEAFTESCNTAFVQLASAHLSASSFPDVASLYGLGSPFQMGFPAFAGKVPAPADGASLAATSIGQAAVVMSPLDMAVVAADVGRGSARPPRLVTGAPSDTAPSAPLPAPTVAGLRSMMASVVTSGTAAGTGLPAGTFAKTGTAEYGSGNPLPTDAWLMGWHGDVAFAMVVQNSKGNGGPVDGPVVAAFLRALPASYG